MKPLFENWSTQNNFDFLRLFFASLVIVSHSFPLSGYPEILHEITNGQTDLGRLAVECFFILSGYLIFQSVIRSKTFSNYLWKRILRLYPALIVLLLLTMLILPVVAERNILNDHSYLTYFWKGLSLYDFQQKIPGVFETNPFPNYINGCLWTLPYEFTMYLVLGILFFFKNKKLLPLILIVLFIASYCAYVMRPGFLSNIFRLAFLNSPQFYRLSAYFIAGSILNYFSLLKFKKIKNIALLFSILLISVYFNFYSVVAPIVLPVLIVLIGLLKIPYLQMIVHKIGDLSYGIYIYGFIVQQIIMNYFALKTIPLMLASFAVVLPLAYLSWHTVEKKMLLLKRKIK